MSKAKASPQRKSSNEIQTTSRSGLPRHWLWRALPLALAAVGGAAAWAYFSDAGERLLTYELVKTYPHDPQAFTQGLVFTDGSLYESTGRYGQSTVRRVDLETGAIEKSISAPNEYFAEGLTAWNDELIQLTWKENIAFVYDRETLERKEKTFRYYGEGWGLTNDGKHLIASDGSATLKFLDPQTFETVRRIRVHSGEKAVSNLNELEYVDGKIYANIWYRDVLVIIDPKNGKVDGWVDLDGLLNPRDRPGDEAVANGIAYDEKNKRLFVTGKNWPYLFEIRIKPQREPRSD